MHGYHLEIKMYVFENNVRENVAFKKRKVIRNRYELELIFMQIRF